MYEDVLKSPSYVARSDEWTAPLRLVLEEPHLRRKSKLLVWTVLCGFFIIVAGIAIWSWWFLDPVTRKNPAFWQATLVTCLFWISVSQGVVAISALIRISHASWRYPYNRILDMGSLFGLWGPLLIPVMIICRRQIYSLGAIPFQDNVWRVAGPVWFDGIAVGTAYLAGWMLLYLTALPDFAALRERPEADPKERRFYGVMTCWPLLVRRDGRVRWERIQWVGSEHQWRVLRLSEAVMVGCILVTFVASQTVLGWDFQLASARDWDASIFAPLYTVGSLLAGCAMSVLLLTITRRFFRAYHFIEARHYDNMGRFMIALGLIWFYFRWCDYLTAWYGHIPDEWNIENSRTVALPIMALVMTIGCFVAPVFGNMIHRVRTTPWGLCTVSVLVLTGLCVQRYLDTVPTFIHDYPLSALYPTPRTVAVFLGVTGMFILTYLAAARYLPAISWWGIGKERTRMKHQAWGEGQVTVMVEDPPVWER